MNYVAILAAHQVSIVAIYLGAWIIVTRFLLVVWPRATLAWLATTLQHKNRVRAGGVVFFVTLLVPMIWAGARNQSETLGQVLLLLGIAGSFSLGWMVIHPTSFGNVFAGWLRRPAGGDVGGWRVLGAVGVVIGLALVLAGWRGL